MDVRLSSDGRQTVVTCTGFAAPIQANRGSNASEQVIVRWNEIRKSSLLPEHDRFQRAVQEREETYAQFKKSNKNIEYHGKRQPGCGKHRKVATGVVVQ